MCNLQYCTMTKTGVEKCAKNVLSYNRLPSALDLNKFINNMKRELEIRAFGKYKHTVSIYFNLKQYLIIFENTFGSAMPLYSYNKDYFATLIHLYFSYPCEFVDYVKFLLQKEILQTHLKPTEFEKIVSQYTNDRPILFIFING